MPDPMTDARLDEISALADAATPGPWEARLTHQKKTGQLAMAYFVRPPRPDSNIDNVKSWTLDEIPDLEFIAASRMAVPELIGEVRRARAAEAAARTERADMRLRLDQANDAAYGMSRAKEITRIQAIQAENAGMKPLLTEAATEIEWLVNKLSEHASYEDAEADARELVARLRALLAAKEAGRG